jgi:hypothetical protein
VCAGARARDTFCVTFSASGKRPTHWTVFNLKNRTVALTQHSIKIYIKNKFDLYSAGDFFEGTDSYPMEDNPSRHSELAERTESVINLYFYFNSNFLVILWYSRAAWIAEKLSWCRWTERETFSTPPLDARAHHSMMSTRPKPPKSSSRT